MDAARTIPPDDAHLVEGVLRGSREDFEGLVERHQRMLTAFAQQRLGNAALADEVVQSTFVKAWTNLAGYRGESSFRSWLCGIAVNECRSVHRTRARRAEVPITAELEELLPSDGETPESEHLRYELRRQIERLPPRQRSVLSLRIFADLPFAEIARLEGTTVSSAKVSYHHAVRRLKEWLA